MKKNAFAILGIITAGLSVSICAAANPFGDMAEKEALEIYNNCTESKDKVGIVPHEEVRLTEAMGESSKPAIAYNNTHEEFGVVWQDKRISIPPFDSSGAAPVYSVYFARVNASSGEKIGDDVLISDGVHDARQPAIAWSPDIGSYLITWADARDCYMEYAYGGDSNGNGGSNWPSPSGFKPVLPPSDLADNLLKKLPKKLTGAFSYNPDSRMLKLGGNFFQKYTMLELKGEGAGSKQMTTAAYDGLHYSVPKEYSRINFSFGGTPKTFYFPEHPWYTLHPMQAKWLAGWYALNDKWDEKQMNWVQYGIDKSNGSDKDEPGRGSGDSGRDGQQRDAGAQAGRGNRSPAPPWIDVSIKPGTLSVAPGETVNLKITAACSDNATIYVVTCELLGNSSKPPKKKSGNGLKKIEWDVSEKLDKPGSCQFKAKAYLYWDKEITDTDISLPIKVQAPVLTPCNPFFPVSWQIYARRVIPFSQGQNYMEDPVPITDPKMTKSAWQPSVAWNDALDTFGLVWLERREGGVLLCFNRMLPDKKQDTAPLVKAQPENQIPGFGLNAPEYTSLASNGGKYVVVYQDRRSGTYSPIATNNVYLRVIDKDGLSGKELKVSSAEGKESSGGPWDTMYWDENEGVFKFAPDENAKAWNGAMCPKIIRTYSKTFIVEIKDIGEREISTGEDWLTVTWEQEGNQCMARFHPEDASKDGGDVVVAQIGSEYFAPAIGAHVTDADALEALYKQPSKKGGGLVALNYANGDLNMSVHDYAGKLKLADAGYEMVSDNPLRIDQGEGFSGYPAVAWSDGRQLYGVTWEDNRFGQAEIYFRLVEVIDRVETDCKENNNSGSSSVSCKDVCDYLGDGGEPPPGGEDEPYLPDGEPLIWVSIEEESSTASSADLWFIIDALSAPGVPLETVEYWISGHEYDIKKGEDQINQSYTLAMPPPEGCQGDFSACPYLKAVDGGGRFVYQIIHPAGLDPYSVSLPAYIMLQAECRDEENTKAMATPAEWEKN